MARVWLRERYAKDAVNVHAGEPRQSCQLTIDWLLSFRMGFEWRRGNGANWQPTRCFRAASSDTNTSTAHSKLFRAPRSKVHAKCVLNTMHVFIGFPRSSVTNPAGTDSLGQLLLLYIDQLKTLGCGTSQDARETRVSVSCLLCFVTRTKKPI